MNTKNTRTGPYFTVEEIVEMDGRKCTPRQLTVRTENAIAAGRQVHPDALEYTSLSMGQYTRGDMVLFAAAPALEAALQELLNALDGMQDNQRIIRAKKQAKVALDKAVTFTNQPEAIAHMKIHEDEPV